MKSDVITISSSGGGFSAAVEETKKAADYAGLDEKKSLRLQLMTEEMLSLARSVTGEMEASFWLERENNKFDLHMTTKTIMDMDKKAQLLSAATSRKNEAARSFLGRLRDAFEEAMLADSGRDYHEMIPQDVYYDVAAGPVEDLEWDGYERSVLRKLADNIKIGIRGGLVDMTVTKDFS